MLQGLEGGVIDTHVSRPSAPLSGALFTVLAVIGSLAAGPDAPGFEDPPAATVDRYLNDVDGIVAGAVLNLLAVAALLFFLAVITVRARRMEREGGLTAAAIAIGGAVGAALMLAGLGIELAAALRADGQGTIDPQVATIAYDSSQILYRFAAPIGWAVALLASARLGLDTAFLPRWLALLSAVLGVLLLIPQVSDVAITAFILWPLIVGAVLYREEPAAGEAERTEPEAQESGD